MTATDIKDLLSKGEHITTECKKAQGGIPKSIWETYSAFANTDGGIILLGIDEVKVNNGVQYEITGVSDADKLVKEFWSTINSTKVSVNVLMNDDVEIVKADGKDVIVIHVPRAAYNFRPVYINDNPAKGTYRRNHEGDYHCTDSEWRAMVRDASDDGNDGHIVEYYTMDDIDPDTLHRYRTAFMLRNMGHIWEDADDKTFLLNMGGYAVDRRTRKEGLTVAGLLMFGKGLPIRDVFDNFRMDYIDFTNCMEGERYSDRLTYDGRWENNLYNFMRIVLPKLTFGLKVPFKLNGMVREDDTPVHKAIREAFTNSIIHADMMTTGVLRIEKREDGFFFSNPGILRISVSSIYEGMHTKARNPRIQQMFRMIGYGENIGSGFPSILKTWKEEHWAEPELTERQDLNEVELMLKVDKEFLRDVSSDKTKSSFISSDKSSDKAESSFISSDKSSDKAESSFISSDKLSAKQQLILDYIKEHPKATQQELADNIEGLSFASAKYQVNLLRKEGLLKRIGSNKTGYLIVCNKTNEQQKKIAKNMNELFGEE